MSPNNLVIISIDALCASELEDIKKLPNFQPFFNKGAYAKKVYSVYPSLTYTCHTSILTGTYPEKHGIFSNYKFQPHKKKPDWHWYAKDIKAKTLVDAAKEKGLTIGNVFWPVMGANDNIDINCPEVWTNDPKEGQIKTSMKAGSTWFQLKMAARFIKYLPGLFGHSQPALDEFITHSACHMIRRYKPELMLIHLIEHDHTKHVQGAKGPHTSDILKSIDRRIGQIVEATKKAGTYDDTTFILLGDHSHLTYHQVINLHYIFEEKGFLAFDDDKELLWWKAYAASQDGSAHIYIKEHDPEIKKKVYTLLMQLVADPKSGIEALYTQEEYHRIYHTGGEFDFILEAKKGYAFGKERRTSHNLVEPFMSQDRYISHHGYCPYKDDYQTLFLARGPGIHEGAIVDEMSLVDIAPTLARLLDLELDGYDGKIKESLIS